MTFEIILTAAEKREMREEVFCNHELVGVDLSGADLRGARFEQVRIESCNLAGADLRGAHFILCTVRSVILSDAQLGANRFYGTTFEEAVGLSDAARARIERDGGVFSPPDPARR